MKLLGGLSITPAFAMDGGATCYGGAFLYGRMVCMVDSNFKVDPYLEFDSSSMWGLDAFNLLGSFHTDSANTQELVDAGNSRFVGGGILVSRLTFNAGVNTYIVAFGTSVGGYGSWFNRAGVEQLYSSLYESSDVKKINSRLTDIYQNTYVATDKGIYKQSTNSNKWELVGTGKKNMTMFLIDNTGRLISSDRIHIYTFNTSNNTWDVYPDVKLIRSNQLIMDNKTITGIVVKNDGTIKVF